MSLAQTLKQQFSPPDDLLLEAGAVGEVLVARIRLIAVMLICLTPPVAWLSGAPQHEVVTGAIVSLLALLFAILLLRKARREGSNTRWRFLSAALDITSISIVLGLFLIQGFPHVAVNSRVVWELYLISIAATALRADSRVCLMAGLLALAQYACILFGATRYGDLNDPRWAPFIYGYLTWGDQISRLILIIVATLLALACVYQTRKLLLLSSQDDLTGIRNRAWLDTRLNRELTEAGLLKKPLCLAMIDVDGFKAFNDRHGHLAGDSALHTLAQRLEKRFIEHGFVARYGGEEFTAVLSGWGLDEARAACQAVRASFEEEVIVLDEDGFEVPSPTVSMGLALWKSPESAESLIDRADRALIEAKKSGRNRVVLAS
ncbi:MAG: GGDEF domain-containing protein [Pseudomonadota bacterium]